MRFKLHKVYYTPGVDVVTIAIQAASGPFKGRIEDLYTTQTALGDAWGDAAVRAEAERQLGCMDCTLE